MPTKTIIGLFRYFVLIVMIARLERLVWAEEESILTNAVVMPNYVRANCVYNGECINMLQGSFKSAVRADSQIWIDMRSEMALKTAFVRTRSYS